MARVNIILLLCIGSISLCVLVQHGQRALLLLPKESCFLFEFLFLSKFRVLSLRRHLRLHHCTPLRQPLHQLRGHELQHVGNVVRSIAAAVKRRAAAVSIEVVYEVGVIKFAAFCPRN